MQKETKYKHEFELLYKSNYVRLYYYALQFIEDSETCKDVLNDVFEKTWKHYESLQKETVTAYLYTNVRNKCIDYLRHSQVESQYADFYRIVTEADMDNGVNEREERLQHIERIIEEMTDPTKTILKECTYKCKEVSQSLNYRTSITRPDFGRLNNYSYYINSFSYQEGNPQLVPQISYRLQYALSYDFLYLSLGYTYVKDYIGFYMYTHSERPEVNISTWRNYDKQQRLNAVLNLRHRFGFYEPSLTGMYQQNMMKVESIEGRQSVDKPLWMVTWENNFHLPKGWLANIEYSYQSAGSSQWFTFKAQHNMNVSLSKFFLNEKLQVKLAGEHLLDRRMSIYDGRINNIYFWQDEDQDQRNVSLSIVYRFNNYTKKYKGQSAADDVLNRL